jgi:AcrR family transcriptional regulator
MARPRNQDERRRQLVAATAAAIGEHGLSGLRLKHIADQAGLSIGSVLYYYPDLDALLVEVHGEAVRQFYWARVNATEAEPDPVRRLVVAVEHGIPDDVDDPTVRVIYELHLASARDERHASQLTRLWELEVSLYVDLLERGAAAGVLSLRSAPREIAETVVALEDAFDLHLLARNDAIARGLAVRRVLDYLALATGTDLSPAPSPRRSRTPV